jgi:hypothetical protein
MNDNIINRAPKNGLLQDKIIYPKNIHEMEMTLNSWVYCLDKHQ